MDQYMKENFQLMICMGKESTFGQIKESMKVTGTIIKWKDLEQ